MSEPRRILVVDDEPQITRVLRTSLSAQGYDIRVANDGETALEILKDWAADLVITDLSMPRMDGLELCRRIRAVSQQVPVMFLTSRDEEFDRVLGLELGADDYLCKPFSVRELCARVKVLLRRGARRESGELLRVGPLELDPPRHTARWKDQAVRLTVTEFRMLQCLARQPGVVRTREQLLAEGFPHDQYMSDRTVDTHIKRLRRKLAAADPAFAGIETIYGLGYRYAAES